MGAVIFQSYEICQDKNQKQEENLVLNNEKEQIKPICWYQKSKNKCLSAPKRAFFPRPFLR